MEFRNKRRTQVNFMLKEKTSISQEDIMSILDACYGKCLNGIPRVSQSVEELAKDYLDKYPNKEQACKAMIKNQIKTVLPPDL